MTTIYIRHSKTLKVNNDFNNGNLNYSVTFKLIFDDSNSLIDINGIDL